MDKQQGALAALLGLVAVAALAFWWTTQEQDTPVATAAAVAPPSPSMTAPVAMPLTGTADPATTPPATNSDAVALGEEVIDQFKKEGDELASRATDLESQVRDGEALIAMKEKQIRELEAQLKSSAASAPAKP
jgi:hypothetical protein